MFEDYYWLNDHSRIFLKRGYLQEEQTPEQRVRAISENAEKILRIDGFADKFESYMKKGWISLSSPIWSNYGNERGLPASCNGNLIFDDIDSILDNAHEVGVMSKHGSGTSAYFGKLRHRGASISVGGESSGPVHFMEIYDSISNVVSQSSVRRGSFAAYLNVDHPDIEEFLRIRSNGNSIQDTSIAVTISDDWMESMLAGDIDKRKIWCKIIQKKYETGYPYLFFVDTANKGKHQAYKDKDVKVWASNLCVAPETLLLTSEGEFPIVDLVGQQCSVWNGSEWSEVTVVKTGEYQRLLTVNLNDGKKLECTPYHKWYVHDGESCIEKRTFELKPGDTVEVFNDGYIPSRAFPQEFSQVLSIVLTDRFDDTYCVNEPKKHKAVFNGILTGQCSETCLPADQDYSFVCVLSSLNLLHYDEWKDTDLVETLTFFLDSVTEEYIQKSKKILKFSKVRKFAEEHRSIGIGVLGWHSYLQSRMIPFESWEAKMLNLEIFETINNKSLQASKELAQKYGEPEMLKGYGERMTTRQAIAPTTSSSFILGQVSPSIEPLNSNYFVKKLAKGSFTYKNPYLKQLLKEKSQDTKEVWKSILMRGGSVQHLEFLDDHEKSVFKTFGEISQKEIVIQAAQRQKYIDQSQSLNIMIPPSVKAKEVSDLLIEGWKLGIKSFYYQRSANPAQELSRSISNCVSCEG